MILSAVIVAIAILSAVIVPVVILSAVIVPTAMLSAVIVLDAISVPVIVAAAILLAVIVLVAILSPVIVLPLISAAVIVSPVIFDAFSEPVIIFAPSISVEPAVFKAVKVAYAFRFTLFAFTATVPVAPLIALIVASPSKVILSALIRTPDSNVWSLIVAIIYALDVYFVFASISLEPVTCRFI